MRSILRCIFCFVSTVSLQGQELNLIPDSKSINLKYFNTDNGISHNNAAAFVQNNQGFIWIGTLNGLNRFDGQNFRTYFPEQKDSSSLSNNVIRHLNITRDGEIGISTSVGFNILNYKTDKFSRYLKTHNNKNGLTENSCYAAVEDHIGNIWIGTWGNKLHCLNRRSNTIKCYQLNVKTPSETIQYLFADENDNIWVGTRGGLFIFRQKTGKFSQFLKDKTKYLQNDTIFKILQDKEKRIWIASSQGLYQFNVTDSSVSRITIKDTKGGEPLTGKKIFTIIEDKTGLFWIGTNYGLVIADSQMKNGKLILPNERNRNSLKNPTIRTIFVDKDNNIWLGAEDGIYVYNRYINQFRYSDIIPDKIKFEASYSHTRIYEGKKGEVWVALDERYEKLDPVTGDYKLVNDETIKSNFPVEIAAGNETTGYFLPALNFRGLYYYNPRTRKTRLFQHSTGDSTSLAGNYIIKVFKDSHSQIWALTNANGLSRYNAETGSFINYYHNSNDSSTLSNNWLFDIQEDNMQNVWVATWSGLSKFNGKKNCFERYLWYENVLVFNITKASDGNFWLGTSNGLIKFDPIIGRTIKVYTTAHGLPENIVHGVLIDSQKNLWVSSTKGLTKFNPVTEKGYHFDATDGLQDKEFLRNAALKTSDGTMFFGGIHGINYFKPESIIPDPNLPSVAITDFKILNNSVKNLKDLNTPGEINSVTEITLSHKDYLIGIDYVALNYINAHKCLYRYKLEDFDEDWNEVGNKLTATYTNLPAGTYLFKVLAANNFGQWNTAPKVLKITITPPFWLTWWFMTLVILVIISGLYFGIRIKFYLLTRRKNELENLVRERTVELKLSNEQITHQTTELKIFADNLKNANELLIEKQKIVEDQKNELVNNNEKLLLLNSTKDKFFSIIAHDLRNPFNAVQGFSELLLKNYRRLAEEKIQRYLHLIHSSSKNGNYLLENLLQWSRSQTDHISFTPVNINIYNLFQETVHYFESDISGKKITVEFNPEPETTVLADENMIRTILRNLISNAIKFTAEEGTIRLSALRSGSYMQISVEDSGIGISDENQKLLFRVDTNISTKGTNSETGTGLGLILCREFVQKHQGEIWVESVPGKGSKFIFTIPHY